MVVPAGTLPQTHSCSLLPSGGLSHVHANGARRGQHMTTVLPQHPAPAHHPQQTTPHAPTMILVSQS